GGTLPFSSPTPRAIRWWRRPTRTGLPTHSIALTSVQGRYGSGRPASAVNVHPVERAASHPTHSLPIPSSGRGAIPLSRVWATQEQCVPLTLLRVHIVGSMG